LRIIYLYNLQAEPFAGFVISKEQVKHIAKLARLGLSDKEIEKFQKELSSILEYMEKLKRVDTSNVEAYFRLISEATFKKGMREDKVKKQEIKTAKKLIKMAPEKKSGYIKVKSVL
jgi:aspartyl-tRNA(Asn)/glutamyl-tRNA(Gln) amidotransferase subunit C